MNPRPGVPSSSIQHGRNMGVSTGGNADTERDLEADCSGSGEDATVRGRLDCRDEGIELVARFFDFGAGVTFITGGERDFLALGCNRVGWSGSLRFLVTGNNESELDGVEAAESVNELRVSVDANSAACCSFQARRVVT
jgi:hypothetical protein